MPPPITSEKNNHGCNKAARVSDRRAISFLIGAAPASELGEWKAEFPDTDFTTASIPLSELVTDGPRRDPIPRIHDPKFITAADALDVGPLQPFVSITIAGDARAYPLRILLWHEIVNDVIGGVPVLISYCPLCNSRVVFDRRFNGKTLTFGNTGSIRHYDMVMYDHQTESWWQQFLGEAARARIRCTTTVWSARAAIRQRRRRLPARRCPHTRRLRRHLRVCVRRLSASRVVSLQIVHADLLAHTAKLVHLIGCG